MSVRVYDLSSYPPVLPPVKSMSRMHFHLERDVTTSYPADGRDAGRIGPLGQVIEGSHCRVSYHTPHVALKSGIDNTL